MSDGRTHDLHGGIAAVVVGGVVAIWRPQLGVWLMLGILAGTFLLSPDLDMWKTRPMKWWGWLRYFWAPYTWAFDHRGLSHGWLTGPISRLLYLGLPVATVWWFFDFKHFDWWVAYLASGVVIGNWIHLFGDL